MKGSTHLTRHSEYIIKSVVPGVARGILKKEILNFEKEKFYLKKK